jgi:hypothetical protein
MHCQVRQHAQHAEHAAGVRAHARQQTCHICFDSYDVRDMCAARCRHSFCKDCWAGYVHNAVGGGPSVLSLRCPLPNCSAVVPLQSQCFPQHPSHSPHCSDLPGLQLPQCVP